MGNTNDGLNGKKGGATIRLESSLGLCSPTSCCSPVSRFLMQMELSYSTPADEFLGYYTALLLLSRETIGGADLCHTWGEDWEGEWKHLALIRWIQ